MENNELKLPNANDKENNKGNVFTKEVTPIKPFTYFLIGVGNTFKKIGLWIADLLISAVLSLLNFLVMVVVGTGKLIYKIYKFIKLKCHQFKYNDWSGRLSYLCMGASCFKHKQYVNGVIYALIEVCFIVFMALGGGYNIYMLGSLGKTETIQPDGGMFDEKVYGDNSIVILILAIMSILAVTAFIFVYLKNIQTAYDNYRIDNYVKYSKLLKETAPFTDKLDDDIAEAFANKINRFNFKKLHEDEIKDYLAKIDNPNSAYKSFVKYLIVETISDSYNYQHLLKLKNSKIARITKSKDRYDARRADGLNSLIAKNNNLIANATEETKDEVTEKCQIAVDKYENATLSGTTKRKQKLDKQNNLLRELTKTHSSFGNVFDIKNNDKYGKFNCYYSDIADIDSELNFYNNYFTFTAKYESSLGGSEDKNVENANKAVELKDEMNAKLAKTNTKFNEIRAKKADLQKQLNDAKSEYAQKLKAAKAEGKDESSLVEEKTKLIEITTRLMGALHDLPSDKSIKALEKEEIRESKHAYVRDKKYLRTNFTPKTFAREEVINLMILEYKINYEDASYYADQMFIKEKGSKEERFLNEEEVNQRLADLQQKREAYVAKFADKYNGRSQTFKEQMKDLFNDKFHITILALPFIGILFFTVLPLIFSILIAFTNFNHAHLPPDKLFTWVGWANFIRLINPDPNDELAALSTVLLDTFSWTMIWAVIATFSNYFLGIIVALMINKDGIKFKTMWRTIFVMTIAIPGFISLLTIGSMLNKGGVLFETFHIGFGEYDYSQGAAVTKTLILLVNIWVGIPYTMLSTTGILLNIPKDLYESSKVDGAGAFTQFVKITMPYILFVTGPYLITSFIGNINNFNVIYFLTGGGPDATYQVAQELGLGQTDLMITFIYKVVTNPDRADYGLASAIGIFVFMICAFFSLIMYNKSGSIQEEDQFQ